MSWSTSPSVSSKWLPKYLKFDGVDDAAESGRRLWEVSEAAPAVLLWLIHEQI